MLENSPCITPSSSLSEKVDVEKSKGMLCFEVKVWPLYFDIRAPYVASHYEAAAGRLLGRIWVFPFIDRSPFRRHHEVFGLLFREADEVIGSL